MPIRDYDATTYYEIGELRDYDATANYKIKEVRDYDATTNYLIYTAQTPDSPTLLNQADEVTSITGGWGINSKEGNAYFQGHYPNGAPGGVSGWAMSYNGNNRYGQGWMFTKKKVNLSGWDKIRLSFYYQRGYGDATKGSGCVFVALASTTAYVGGNASNHTQSSDANKYTYATYSSDSGATTIDLDISGVEGEYYIHVGRYNKTEYCVFSTVFQSVTLI